MRRSPGPTASSNRNKEVAEVHNPEEDVSVVVIEDRHEGFVDVGPCANHLRWPLEVRDSRPTGLSKREYPHVELSVIDGRVSVAIIVEPNTHASVGFMDRPERVQFETFRRERGDTITEVRSVTISNREGCWIMLSDEHPSSFFSGCEAGKSA